MRRLIIRPGAIGDFLVSLPALESLKTSYTEIWTAEANIPLARFADRAESIVSSGIDTVELPGRDTRALQRLREFDSIVSWYGTARPEFRAAVAGLPFTFLNALPTDSELHAVDFYLQQAGAPLGAMPRLPVSRMPVGYAVIHPFSGGRKKNWPLQHFRAVAAQLEAPVYWTAGPEEPLDEATRFDSLWDLAQWIAGARVYIGNDSGITHLAAAAGVPVVALFGPTDPRIWAPRGENVTVLRSPDHSMETISASNVLAAASAYLRR